MSYGKNILPTEAAYYTFDKASIENGVLSIEAGGTAYINLDKTYLASLTDSMLLSLYPDTFTNSYIPNCFVYMDIVTAETSFSIAATPTYNDSGIYSAIINLVGGAYTSFRFSIKSEVAMDFILWELSALESADITTAIDGVTQSLPKLLYDYNENIIVVDNTETTIGLIACDLKANTDLQGHFIMDLQASEYCNVHLRFKDNEVTELWSPLLFTLQPGHNTITVPHSYIGRLAGVHGFVVTAQTTNGTLTMYPRDILFTIDGGYLAERLANMGIDVLDITIEQKSTDSNPSYIWCIGLDSGEILVRKRAYTVDVASTIWTPMYSLGIGKLAAIEFDGEWILRDTDDFFTLETYDNPFIFIVKGDNNDLFVYKGNDLTSVYQLDTNVTMMSVIRGFKSQLYPEQDQGVLCVYIKSGVVYYRSYGYDITDSTYKWFASVEVGSFTTAIDVHVHRLNDYRVGIVVSTPTENIWFITERTYVAQSIKGEKNLIDIVESVQTLSVVSSTDLFSFYGTVVEIPSGVSSTFSVSFEYNIIQLKEDIDLSNYTLMIEGVTVSDGIESITIATNILTFTLKESYSYISGVNPTEVKIITSTLDFALLYKNMYHPIYFNYLGNGTSTNVTGNYIWNLIKPADILLGYTNELNALSIAVITSLTMNMPAIEYRNSFNELFAAGVYSSYAPVYVQELTTMIINQEELFTISTTEVITISLVLIGETPI